MVTDTEARAIARRLTKAQREAGIKWEVFPNPNGDEGGWFSYVENATHYLGGDWHKTKRKAEDHARGVVRAALVEMEAQHDPR